MGRKRKYADEYDEVVDAVSKGNLPYKILTAVPRLLHKALYTMLYRRGIRDIGLSEEEDGLWVRRKDER